MNLQTLLDKYKIRIGINTILDMWNESHRYWHNSNHLNDLISQINEKYFNNVINDREKDKLTLIALFHDIIYDPKSNKNEENSADFFWNLCEDKECPHVHHIKQSILDTKSHDGYSKLSKDFNEMDMSIVERDYDSLLEWEKGINSEYKFVGNDLYKEGRLKFLESLLDKYPQNTENLLKLVEYVKTKY